MKLIFIDIDNTLLDFDEYVRQAMREGFAAFGLKSYEEYMYNVFTEENRKLWTEIECGKITFSELEKARWNNVFKVLGINFDGEVFEKYFREKLFDSAIPVPGAYEMLEKLSDKYILSAASNGPYEQQCHRLEISDMKKYFKYIFISEKAGASKPSEKFFDYAFKKINAHEKYEITPSETMIIGDSMSSDILGGMRYGIKTCYYDRQGRGIEKERPDIVVTSLCKVAKEVFKINEKQ